MMPISVDKFWGQNPTLKNNEKWVSQINIASTRIADWVSKHFNARNDNSSSAELEIFSELLMFDPGSRAARYWAGFGAGKGKIGYHVKLKNGEKVIDKFDAYGTLVMGVLGGNITTAHDKCADAIIQFVENHS